MRVWKTSTHCKYQDFIIKTRYTNLPDNKEKAFGGAYSVHDSVTKEYVNHLVREYPEKEIDHDLIREGFIDTYKSWMPSTHKFKGFEKFTEGCFTQGTTESFAQFYIRYRNHKRLRLAKGEYFYHQMMHGLWYKDSFAWLDEDDIRMGDVLLLSVPFSDTGAVPYNLEELLDECDRNNVHVMLDLAYVNLAVGLEINFEHRCIQYVVSSLSKVFPVENHRIGIRLQKPLDKFEDQIYVINEKGYNYINLLSAYVGKEMMVNFEANYIYNKYRDAQDFYCRKYDVTASPSVYFGIDHNNKYPVYNRGNDTNRLCFSRIWDGRKDEL